ncbi:MAG: hypothetical protein F4Y35_08765 [Chloroflexi bacterium]|nr:hypothetical protein [Chloroflexota bacterium]
MSRKERAGAHADEELLAALDRLVAAEGVVKAGERLGVNYRTAASCLETRHVSRRMRDVLEKHLREQREQQERLEQEGEQASASEVNEAGGGEEARLQDPVHVLQQLVDDLRAEVASLRERVDMVEGRVSRGSRGGDDGVDVENVDIAGGAKQLGLGPVPRRIFPELITEREEPGEEQIYGAATELVVEWRQAWAARRTARHTLGWLRAERRRLELELRLVGEFGLTPPPADAPWRERRRDRELDWRRRAVRRLRWQLMITWCMHWLLRMLSLGLWGRQRRG